MAGNEEAEPVAGAEGAGGPRGTRGARERRQLAVRHDLAPRDRPQLARAPLEERRLVLEVELDVVERVDAAREVPAQPRDELPGAARSGAWHRFSAGERQLVPDDAVAVEPELAHAPVLDLVRNQRHAHARNPRIRCMSVHGSFRVPQPYNEPVRSYA